MVACIMWKVVASLLTCLLCTNGEGGTLRGEEVLFSNSWAVEVGGGADIADRVARSHGFVNKGQVGSLANIYHFVHVLSPTRERRNVDDVHPQHFHLQSEDNVGYVEQQIVKQRLKRDHSYIYSPPSNTKWRTQWYLHRSNGHDMNVEKAWEQNVIGRGVVVSILDDGIEYTHPDLKENYDRMASYDFNDHDDDPIPRYDPTNENKHGTRCAGEVAAKKSGQCGVGAAYGSRVGGVRMLDGDVTDVVEASSLSLQPQHIDIYSSSWGPNDDGKTVDGPGKLASKAFTDGVAYGRNGLGSIFVWAAGNGGRYGDSCNCDGYAVSPLTISVGSASEHDKRPWYLEKCSSTLTSTYSSGGVSEKQIVTTDIRNKCTDRHTGTSASAPLAAGIMALALEVNANLTWRDMQYLMVYSSNPKYPYDSEWQVNGAGLHVSHWYGFGIIDGATLVNRARNWVSVPERRNCTYNVTSQFHGNEVSTSHSPLIIDVPVRNCDLAYMEHVQAITSLHLTGGTRKDISVTITSPAGTVSTLLPFRPRDRHKEGFHSWPFMTVHFWGEKPQGSWVFSINVLGESKVKVHVDALHLIIYGTQSVPPPVLAIPNQCHSQCVNGCAKEGPKYCDICKHYRIAETLECVQNCPLGTYSNRNTCHHCPALCAECSGAHTCTKCLPHAFRQDDESCTDRCSDGTFPTSNGSCSSCHLSCMSCDGPLESNCTSCHPQFTLRDSACVIHESTSCPTGQYFDHRAHECRLCHATCASCEGKESNQCTACFGGAVINEEGRCTDSRQLRMSCFPGQYFDGDEFACATCPSTCDNCSNTLTCTSCPPGASLTRHGSCVRSCLPNTGKDHSVCYGDHCHQSCLTCFGPESINCNSCYEGLLLADNSCVQKCPTHSFRSDLTCRICHSNCESCHGPTENDCDTCPPNKQLSDHSCATYCPNGTYSQEGMCHRCMADCSSCLSQESCIICRSGYYVLDIPPLPRCVPHCPSGFVVDPFVSSCQPCPSNCITCNTSSTCHSCKDGYVYYAPSGICEEACPLGYYSTPARDCTSCQLPCSTCVGSALNCSTCSRGMALDSVSQTCKECCNADKTTVNCCDCYQDSQFCHWLNSTHITPFIKVHAHISTHVIVGICIVAVLLLGLGGSFLLVFVKCYLSRSSRIYKKVPNKDGFDITDDFCSDSDIDHYNA